MRRVLQHLAFQVGIYIFCSILEKIHNYLSEPLRFSTLPSSANGLPKIRKLWEPEPRNTIYFEALALARVVLESGPNFQKEIG